MADGKDGKDGARRASGRLERWTAVLLMAAVGAALVAGGCGGRRAELDALQEAASGDAGDRAAPDGMAATVQGARQAPVQPAAETSEQPAFLQGLRQTVSGGLGGGSATVGLGTLLAGRKLVRTADLELEVRDLDLALERIHAIAVGAGGIVTATNIYSSSAASGGGPPGGRAAGAEDAPQRPVGDGVPTGEAGSAVSPREGSVTVRVPVARFEGALAELRRLGRLVQESVSTQDVTGQYVDLEARAASLEEQERRLRLLVGRSGSLEEVLRLENELARVRGEIESLRGQLRTLGEQADYSTLNLSLKETLLASPRIEAPRGLGARSAQAFVRGVNLVLQAGGTLFVALAAVAPPALALGGPALAGWLAYRALRRRSRPA